MVDCFQQVVFFADMADSEDAFAIDSTQVSDNEQLIIPPSREATKSPLNEVHGEGSGVKSAAPPSKVRI